MRRILIFLALLLAIAAPARADYLAEVGSFITGTGTAGTTVEVNLSQAFQPKAIFYWWSGAQKAPMQLAEQRIALDMERPSRLAPGLRHSHHLLMRLASRMPRRVAVRTRQSLSQLRPRPSMDCSISTV